MIQDSEFRPAHEVFTGGGGQLDLDYLQQHGSESSSVSHLARFCLLTLIKRYFMSVI